MCDVLGISYIQRRLTGQNPDDFLRCAFGLTSERFMRPAGQVGSSYHVGQGKQRIALLCRLNLENIKPGACYQFPSAP